MISGHEEDVSICLSRIEKIMAKEEKTSKTRVMMYFIVDIVTDEDRKDLLNLIIDGFVLHGAPFAFRDTIKQAVIRYEDKS